MNCNSCKVPMVPGKVLAPILGSQTQVIVGRGDTIYDIGQSALTDCMKCPNCGHSVGPVLVRDDSRSDDLWSFGGYGPTDESKTPQSLYGDYGC